MNIEEKQQQNLRTTETLIALAKKMGAEQACAVSHSSNSVDVNAHNGKVEKTEGSENNAIILKVFQGKRSASINLSGTTANELPALVEKAVAMARVAPENPFDFLPEEFTKPPYKDFQLYDANEVDAAKLKDLCEEMTTGIRAIQEIEICETRASSSVGGFALSTSKGFSGSIHFSSISIFAEAIAGKGDEMQTRSEYDSAIRLGELKSPLDLGNEAAEAAIAALNPIKIASAKLPIIFSPRTAKSFLGHLASAINGHAVARGTSFLKNHLGKAIMPKWISITDDPTLIGRMGSRPFDAEGQLPQPLELVKDGVLQCWLLDWLSARELGLVSNARAALSGGGSTHPAASNLTLKPGSTSVQDMIRNTKRGIFVNEFIGQGVNLVSGDYSRGATGFLIESGELTKPVSEITLSGNLKDIFMALNPASETERFGSVETPALMLDEITVAGQG